MALNIIFGIFAAIWLPFVWVFGLLKRFFVDVLKGVYSKAVKVVAGVVFFILIAGLIRIFHG